MKRFTELILYIFVHAVDMCRLHGNIVSNKFDIFSLGVVMTKIIVGPNGHTRHAEMHHQEFLDQVRNATFSPQWNVFMLLL